MRKNSFPLKRHLRLGLAVGVVVWATAACTAVKSERRVPPFHAPAPLREASTDELVADLKTQSDDIHTLTAQVNFETTTGSVYSGVIREYRDVKGFILLVKPSMIRIIGEAPVVQTTIFDMVSDGKEFRLYIPPKHKFIIGSTTLQRQAKNQLENMRPQHILDALLVPPIDPARDKYFSEEAEDGDRRFYVVSVLESGADGQLSLERKIWFDRSSFETARLQLYGSGGRYFEDVRYTDYQNFQGVRYPTRILLKRPVEDYQLAITILNATLNQPIEAGKFDLKRPEGVDLVDLNKDSPPRSEPSEPATGASGSPHGQ